MPESINIRFGGTVMGFRLPTAVSCVERRP